MSDKIKITASGDKDQSELTDCYFLPTNTSGKYILFAKNDLPIVTSVMPLYSGASFSFNLPTDTFTWYIPNPAPGSEQFTISDTNAAGSWSNTDVSIADEEAGSFTAQTSGHVEDEESASSATA